MTAADPSRSRLPAFLLGAYLVLFAVLAVHPFDRGVWVAENLPIVLVVAGLAATARRYRFSDTAYLLMAVLVVLHTVGGHYTFERVPFGWVTETFGFARNHYDRVAHFSVGLYAFAGAELLHRRRLVTRRWLVLAVPVLAVLAVASVYEIVEWLYAAGADAAAGAAFLGSQGDPWDAQKDMLADGLGAVFAVLLYRVLRRPARVLG